jgi:hypothetical protein
VEEDIKLGMVGLWGGDLGQARKGAWDAALSPVFFTIFFITFIKH